MSGRAKGGKGLHSTKTYKIELEKCPSCKTLMNVDELANDGWGWRCYECNSDCYGLEDELEHTSLNDIHRWKTLINKLYNDTHID